MVPGQSAPAATGGGTSPTAVACRCGKRFAAPPHLAGKRVACPACRSPIQVPQAAGAAGARVTAPAPQSSPDDDGFWDEIKPSEPSPFHGHVGVMAAPSAPVKKEVPSPAKATSYAIECSARGMSSTQIRAELIEMGVGPEESMRIVETLHGRDDKLLSSGSGGGGLSDMSAGIGHIMGGILLLLLGAGVTAGSFMMAVERGGGTYYFMGGPIIWGLIHIFIGIGKSVFSD